MCKSQNKHLVEGGENMNDKPMTDWTKEEIKEYQQRVLDESYKELQVGYFLGNLNGNELSIEQQIKDIKFQIKHTNNYMEKRKLQQELNGLQYKLKNNK